MAISLQTAGFSPGLRGSVLLDGAVLSILIRPDSQQTACQRLAAGQPACPPCHLTSSVQELCVVSLHCLPWLLLQSTKKQLRSAELERVMSPCGKPSSWQQEPQTGSRKRKALEQPAVQQSLGSVCCGSCHSHQKQFAALQRQAGLSCAGSDIAEATRGFSGEGEANVSVPGLQGYQVKSQACSSRLRCGHAQACKVLCCCVCPLLA